MTKSHINDKTKKGSKIKIDPKIRIPDLLAKYPELIEVLSSEFGLYCVNCFFSELDTLKEGARIHGIEGKSFAQMLDYLEDLINK